MAMQTSVRDDASLGHEAERRRSVTVLGSTGSVGEQTIDLIRRHPERFSVAALTANRSVDSLAAQARQLQPELAVVADPDCYRPLKEALSGTGVEPAAGPDALVEAAERSAELVVAGIVGAAGLPSALAAVRRGAKVALANKECLVCAGDLMIAEIRRNGATLLPVDSEHNAIFQVFDAERADGVEKIILTASGGPFREAGAAEMEAATPAQAVAHPNWDMGAKISVDSATMMNKGLEIIEAYYLFPVDKDQIEVLIHPQSIIHSMVAYIDGSVLAQLGSPDMRTPIAYCLAYPDRIATPSERLDLATIGQLTFQAPDLQRFPCLRLAREALQSGGCGPTILNAANEVAVRGFLDGNIKFTEIPLVVEGALEKLPSKTIDNLDDVLAVDAEARQVADGLAFHGGLGN